MSPGYAMEIKLQEIRTSGVPFLPRTIIVTMLAAAFGGAASLEVLAADVSHIPAPPVPGENFDAARYGDFRDTLHDWKVMVGVGAIYLPEYEGSDKFDIKPFPLFSAEFGDRVEVNVTGLTVDVFEQGGFTVGLKAGYELGRQEDDSRYLRGLGDIDLGVVIGGVVSYETGPLELYGKVDKTVGGSEGLTAAIGAKASYRHEQFIFSADVYGTWADDNHMASYFGVNAGQSARSGLSEYKAEAGVKRIDVKGSVTYMLSENWNVTGAGGVGFLMGDAKDSPIVKDDVQPFAMLGVGYRF